jgi:hypothetical protein
MSRHVAPQLICLATAPSSTNDFNNEGRSPNWNPHTYTLPVSVNAAQLTADNDTDAIFVAIREQTTQYG